MARYGGEQFVAILTGVELDGAVAWADRLRAAVRAAAAAVVEVTVTASLGVAVWTPGDLGRDVVGRADRALYRAKETGRDRVSADSVDDSPGATTRSE